MKYKIHLVNPFGKRCQTRGFFHNRETALSAIGIWKQQFPECSYQLEEYTEAEKLPLIVN